MPENIIETNVDRLMHLVNSKEKVSFEDAANKLGLSMSVITELANILEEEGIISTGYRFTKPMLIRKEMSQKELDAKRHELESRKDVFRRKAEGHSRWVENEIKNLKGLQKDFDKIKKTGGVDFDKLKEEILELDRYHDAKIKIDKELEAQRHETREKIDNLNRELRKKMDDYNSIISGVDSQSRVLESQKEKLEPLKKMQEQLQNKIKELEDIFRDYEVKMMDEEKSMQEVDENLKKLQEKGQEITDKARGEKDFLIDSMKKSSLINAKIIILQKNILEKLGRASTNPEQVKLVSQQMQKLFDKKVHTLDLAGKINKDSLELESQIKQLVSKSRLLSLSFKDKSPSTELQELENIYRSVSEKKKKFEDELKELRMNLQ